ncbi:hypothetical protein MPSEU_000772100 [Mayamaea pseudoterrestris]|nr:hypothetical protein MPSEU_000772100 [Mayamaea pseudoterrestris]
MRLVEHAPRHSIFTITFKFHQPFIIYSLFTYLRLCSGGSSFQKLRFAFGSSPELSSRIQSREGKSTIRRYIIMSSTMNSYIDIGANLLDDRFLQGVYRGQARHEPDVHLVIQRARQANVCNVILTAGTLEESQRSLQYAREWNQLYSHSSEAADDDHHDNDTCNAAIDNSRNPIRFYSTVGIHPTRCQQEFVDSPLADDEILQQLLDIAKDGMTDGTVVAIGEIGLDYDRLEFCDKHVQHEYLIKQLLALARPTGLPLFLHNRSVSRDLVQVLREHEDCWKQAGAVAHSFDDTLELAQEFIELGCYIGLNGCSLRTEDNLNTVKELPLDHILLETDCPYCEVRPTHAGYKYIQTQFEAKAEKKYERSKLVKSRQEPCHVVQVAEIIAGVKDLDLKVVADACFENTRRLFRFAADDDDI